VKISNFKRVQLLVQVPDVTLSTGLAPVQSSHALLCIPLQSTHSTKHVHASLMSTVDHCIDTCMNMRSAHTNNLASETFARLASLE
jgi:hypothetical protein